MEPEGSLSHLQVLATCPYLQEGEITLIKFLLILCSEYLVSYIIKLIGNFTFIFMRMKTWYFAHGKERLI